MIETNPTFIFESKKSDFGNQNWLFSRFSFQKYIYLPRITNQTVAMKIIIAIILGTILSSLCIQSCNKNVLRSNTSYSLIFEDDFNNGTTPDTNYWSVPPRNPYRWSRLISDNPAVAYIMEGKLICKAIPTPTSVSDTSKIITGAVSTKGKFDFTYGKVIVRMRTNNVEGNFPAAWLIPTDGGGNPYRYGEIDIFETFGCDGIAHQTIHNHRSFVGLEKAHYNNEKIDIHQWHEYGVEWTPSFIRLTIDDKETAYLEKSKNAKELEEGQWTFDRPFYIILNQSVGEKGWHEPLPQTEYYTEFDWIRVYQKNVPH